MSSRNKVKLMNSIRECGSAKCMTSWRRSLCTRAQARCSEGPIVGLWLALAAVGACLEAYHNTTYFLRLDDHHIGDDAKAVSSQCYKADKADSTQPALPSHGQPFKNIRYLLCCPAQKTYAILQPKAGYRKGIISISITRARMLSNSLRKCISHQASNNDPRNAIVCNHHNPVIFFNQLLLPSLPPRPGLPPSAILLPMES